MPLAQMAYCLRLDTLSGLCPVAIERQKVSLHYTCTKHHLGFFSYCEYGILLNRDLELAHLLSELPKVLMDLLDDNVRFFTGQEKIEKFTAARLAYD